MNKLEDLKPVVYGIVFISFIGVVFILVIEILRPGKDNFSLETLAFSGLTPALFALIGALKANQAVDKVNQLSESIKDQTNSQTNELKQDNANTAAAVVQSVADISAKAATDAQLTAIAVQQVKTGAVVDQLLTKDQ